MNEKQILYDLFQAYYDARKNKRNTLNQLDFEYNLESNIIKLWQEIISWTYEVGRSIYFIQEKPVKREIFAWDFRDRIVHHLVYNYISPIFEKDFIYDSYSCRVWKWTSFGIKRVQKFIRSCSENYTKDCYILKLDISGYFMSMNKDILWEKIEKIFGTGTFKEYQYLKTIIQKIIYNDPTKNSIFKWKKRDYLWLPKNKSLFFAKPNCWLPIWNLTSQLFSNIYLSDFDKFIKNKLSCKYYWRYVDDFVIVHEDKEFLVSLIPKISNYLKIELWLTLHPKKIYLQYYSKGILFLGNFIKPYRIYAWKRVKINIYNKINLLNQKIRQNNWKMDKFLKQDFRQTFNSYLWLIKHQNSYNLRKNFLLNKISNYFWNEFYISNWYTKVTTKRK